MNVVSDEVVSNECGLMTVVSNEKVSCERGRKWTGLKRTWSQM